MLPEVKQIEGQLKQILYGCVEHVQATKAALYLSVAHDLNAKTYEIVTSYQYNVADRKVVTANDDLVDRLTVKRSPFFVNGLGADQRFSEMLFRQGNDRLLVSRSSRADAWSASSTCATRRERNRSSARRRARPRDRRRDAQRLASQQTVRPRADHPRRRAGIACCAAGLHVVRPSAPLPAAPPAPTQGISPAAQQAIDAARQFMARRQLAVPASGRRMVSEADLELVRLLLPTRVIDPGRGAGRGERRGGGHNPHAGRWRWPASARTRWSSCRHTSRLAQARQSPAHDRTAAGRTRSARSRWRSRQPG